MMAQSAQMTTLMRPTSLCQRHSRGSSPSSAAAKPTPRVHSRHLLRVAAAGGDDSKQSAVTSKQTETKTSPAGARDDTQYYSRLLKLEADQVAGREAGNVDSNLKLALVFTVLLAGLTAAFLASNGLL